MELGCRNGGYDSCRAEKNAEAAKEAENQRVAVREAACRENVYGSCQAKRAREQRVAEREAACSERGYESCASKAEAERRAESMATFQMYQIRKHCRDEAIRKNWGRWEENVTCIGRQKQKYGLE